MDLKKYTDSKINGINKALMGYLHQEEDKKTSLMEAMTYSLMAGGKRIRPILCIASAEAVGGNEIDVMPLACAIEMIHTYSLIHDDLPALDDDDLRRGQPTCHIRFDEPTAILAGDGLLTKAFEVLSSAALMDIAKKEVWLSAIHSVAQAAGCRGMIEGQMRDIASENKFLDIDYIEKMHDLKTGALIRTSIQTGALIAKGDDDKIKKLEIFGKNIGLAFQVTDDILNVTGDPSVMGKAVGTDSQRNKNTYPALLGLAESEKYAKHLIQNALDAILSFDQKADPLREIANYIIYRNK